MAVKKRERLQRYLAGEAAGYVPAAFFLHFGDDYKQGEAAIDRHKEYFAFTDMDFVKIQFELKFPQVTIDTPADFERIHSLPADYYKPQLEVVKGLVDALKSEAFVIVTLYSPFMIAGQMTGNQTVIDNLEKDPEAVFKGIESITESLLEFIRECRKIGLDGFYHSTQGGEVSRLKSSETFEKWVKPSDLRVMNEIEAGFPFSILHVCDYHQEYGGYDSVDMFTGYPGTVVNVPTKIGGRHVSPAELGKSFGRPFMGGMDRLGVLATGSDANVRAEARAVLAQLPPKSILGADCTVPGTTPWTNLQAAIEEAHRWNA